MSNDKTTNRPTEDNSENQLISITTAAKTLGISPETLRRWDKEGRIKSIRVGAAGRRLFKKSDLEAIFNISL